MGFIAGDDLCLGFWAKAWSEGWCSFPPGAHVLEIGCAEADWQTPMLAVRPDLTITGLDWRTCDRPGTFVKADVMNPDLFPPESFDAIVSVSAIEHVGLGAYDADPLEPAGDMIAMMNAHLWLKAGGWMYLDVPYRDTYAVHKGYRAYDEAALAERLYPGFRVKYSAECAAEHPDAPYIALLLEKV